MTTDPADPAGLCRLSARADELAAVTPADGLPPLHGVPMTHRDTHATAGIRATR